MAADVRTPSEIVFLHAPRFADFRERGGFRAADDGVPVDPEGLACAMVFAAFVANHRARAFTLRAADQSALFGLLMRRDVLIESGSAESTWPPASLEHRLATALREATTQGNSATLRRVLVASRIARRGATALLVEVRDAVRLRNDAAPSDVIAVETMLGEFRAADPRLALWLRRSIHAMFSTRSPDAILVPPMLPRRPKRKEAHEVDLSDWDRLNRNPPSATDPKPTDSKR